MDTNSHVVPMPDHWSLFERSRRRLVGVAGRILGSSNDAEDVVQEAALRWLRTNPATVRTPEGWLVAVVSRLALDRLRRLVAERKAYRAFGRETEGAEPAVTAPDDEPESGAQLAKSFEVLRDRLEPVERVAFALRELFDCGYEEIARALAKSEAACRQIVHRARGRLIGREPRRIGGRDGSSRHAQLFLEALRNADRDCAISMLLSPAVEAPLRRAAAPRSGGSAAQPWRCSSQAPTRRSRRVGMALGIGAPCARRFSRTDRRPSRRVESASGRSPAYEGKRAHELRAQGRPPPGTVRAERSGCADQAAADAISRSFK